MFFFLLFGDVSCVQSRLEGPKVIFYGDGNISQSDVTRAGSFLAFTTLEIQSNILQINDNAFSICEKLQKVLIGDSVRIIGKYAFSELTSLTQVTFGAGLQFIDNAAFSYCSLLNHILIPKSCKSLGSSTFIKCSALTTFSFEAESQLNSIATICFIYTSISEIDLPESLVSLEGSRIFCSTKLKSIYIGKNVQKIGGGLVAECSSLTEIRVSPDNPYFASVDGLLFDKSLTKLVEYPAGLQKSFKIGSTITSLESYCFSASREIELTFENPVKITSIPTHCFQYSLISNLVLPEGITSLKDMCFDGCGIMNIFIPSTVCTIASSAFSRTTSLPKLTGISENSNFYEDSTSYTVYKHDFSEIIFVPTTLTTISFPEGLTFIPQGLFLNKKSLTSVHFSSTIKYISGYAFGNSGLLELVIPANIQRIYIQAFTNTPLTKVTYEANCVTFHHEYIFSGCKSLKSVVFNDGCSMDLGEAMFQNCIKLRQITLHPYITSVGKNCFLGSGLQSVFLSSAISLSEGSFMNTKIAAVSISEETIPLSCFRQNLELESLTIEKTVGRIESLAFEGCQKLASVTFSETEESELVYLESMSFANCIELATITLPTSVLHVTASVFSRCSCLRAVNIEADSGSRKSSYRSEGGAVYNKNLTTFILCPAGAVEISIKKEVMILGNEAFSGCTNLKEVVFEGENIEEFSSYCFYGCDSLEELNIPINIKRMGKSAIDSPKLKKLFYCGTTDETITVEEGAFVGNPMVIVSANYGPLTFKNEIVVKSKSIRPNGCPNEPSKPFSIVQNEMTKKRRQTNGIKMCAIMLCYLQLYMKPCY